MKLQLYNILPQGSKFTSKQQFLFIIASIIAVIVSLLLPVKYVIAINILLLFSLAIVFTKIHLLQVYWILMVMVLITDRSHSLLFKIPLYIFVALVVFYYFADLCLKVKKPKMFLSHHMIAIIFILLGLLALLSLIYNYGITTKGISEVINYFLIGILFLTLFHFMENETIIRKLIFTIIACSIIITLYSYWLIYAKGLKAFMILGITAMRGIDSGLSNPNVAAMMIGYAMPFLLSYSLFGRVKKSKLLASVGLIPLTIIWLLWNSRSIYVFFFCAVLTIIAFHKKRIKYYLSIAVISISFICLIFIFPIFQDLLRLNFGVTYRDSLWQASIRIIKQNPILGSGPDSYRDIRFYYMDPSLSRDVLGKSRIVAHNYILDKTSELGIGAFIVIIFYWSYVIYYFIKEEKLLRGKDYYYIYIGCAASFIGFIFRSFFETTGATLPIIILAIIFKLPHLQKAKPYV